MNFITNVKLKCLVAFLFSFSLNIFFIQEENESKPTYEIVMNDMSQHIALTELSGKKCVAFTGGI